MSAQPGIINPHISDINPLRLPVCTGYISPVAPQWATGRGNPCNSSATTDAPCVFFYVAINATERHFMAWCVAICTGLNRSFLYLMPHPATSSMVAQAGHPKGWPVFDEAGISTPVWAIAIHERGNSGDSKICYSSEVALWLRPSPKLIRNTPGCFWPFAVLTCTADRTVSKSLPLITTLRAVLSHGITLPLLPDAFPAVRLAKPCHALWVAVIPVTEIPPRILSRPEKGFRSFLILIFCERGNL